MTTDSMTKLLADMGQSKNIGVKALGGDLLEMSVKSDRANKAVPAASLLKNIQTALNVIGKKSF